MKLIVDSTCDIDSVYMIKKDVKMIPLQVIIEGKTYRDKKEIRVDEVYEYIKKGIKLQTSLPLVSDMLEVFEPLAKSGEPFIYLAFTSALSGTYNAASLVLSQLKDEYPNMTYAIVDSKAGALGYGLLALDLIKEMDRNEDFNHLVEHAKKQANNINHIFMVNNLDQLKKGGRISHFKALIGSLLSIRPLLRLVDGRIEPYKSSIGTKRALNDLANYIEKQVTDKETLIGINYSNDDELANQIEVLLRHRGFTNFVREQIGSVFASHIGLDAVGLYYIQ
jgi:DegV family protein with EDD domain